MIRPGPDALPAGLCPGGVIVHVYAVPSCRLLVERELTHADTVDVAARADSILAWTLADQLDADAVCLVAYDGDTGARMTWGDDDTVTPAS